MEELKTTTLPAEEVPARPQVETRKLIIVTGFGVFEGHEEKNASWEAVRLLPTALEELNEEFVIEKIEVPVEYGAVDKQLEHIWAREPALVIHVGVHGQANCIRVEKLAYNHKFNRADYAGKRLRKPTACLKNCDGIQNDVKHTCFKVDKICEAACACTNDEQHEPTSSMTSAPILNNEIDVNAKKTEAAIASIAHDNNEIKNSTKTEAEALAISSKDVGNYLCGYIYIKSLDYNDKRTLFVHVPPVEQLSAEVTCDSLLKIIKECIRQLKQDMNLL